MQRHQALACAVLLTAIVSTPTHASQTNKNTQITKSESTDFSARKRVKAAKAKRHRHFRSARSTATPFTPSLPVQDIHGVGQSSYESITFVPGRTERRKHVARHVAKATRTARVRRSHGSSLSLAGVVPPLRAKVEQIVANCGSRVTSAVRHTFVRYTRTISLHASGRAVDIQGNPACIRRLTAGWPGGMSTDYWRVRHYHLSWGGREHGIRFAHYSGKAKRYARR